MSSRFHISIWRNNKKNESKIKYSEIPDRNRWSMEKGNGYLTDSSRGSNEIYFQLQLSPPRHNGQNEIQTVRI